MDETLSTSSTRVIPNSFSSFSIILSEGLRSPFSIFAIVTVLSPILKPSSSRVSPFLFLAFTIRSFQPNSFGYATKAEYDRTATVTGRLKTTSGPTLLHLPKVY
jgi:hypothetical protein